MFMKLPPTNISSCCAVARLPGEAPTRHNDTRVPQLFAKCRRVANGTSLAERTDISALQREEFMRSIRTSTVLAAMFLGTLVSPAHAQETVTAKVPFPFVVRGEQFPAGRYEFTAEQGLLTMRGQDNASGVFAMTLPADGRDPAAGRPSLVFVRSENAYLLSQVWESDSEGLALLRPSLMPKHAHNQAQAEPLIVLASRPEVSGK